MPVSADLICVPPVRVSEIWPHVKHLIEAAMKRSDLGRFDVLEEDVLNGDALLWLAYSGQTIEAAAVTQIVLTEISKVCALRACGGTDRKRWIGLLRHIEQYAKQEACDCVRIAGRKGWARALPEYREARVILERRL